MTRTRRLERQLEPEATAEGKHGPAVLTADGDERRRPLAQVAEVAFEDVAAVRPFPAFHGQRNNTGWWWVATTSRHVGYESWLERDHVIRLDFDRDVVGLASQPF